MLQATAIVELVWQDETGSTAATVLRCASSLTVSEMDVGVSAFASIVASITGCVLVRQRIKYTSVVDSPSAAASGSSIKRAGVFIFEDDSGDNQDLVSIPGILDDVLVVSGVGAGVLIDVSDSRVVALITELADIGSVNPFAVECANLVAAYRQSRV
jgi:hypothetical protein